MTAKTKVTHSQPLKSLAFQRRQISLRMIFGVMLLGALTNVPSAVAGEIRNVQNFITGIPHAAGTVDHSAAIQRAIDQAPPGTTLYFPPGNYVLSEPLTLKSGHIYKGTRSSILRPSLNRVQALMTLENTRGVLITGFTFQGGGIKLVETNTGTQIVSNTFLDIIDRHAEFGDESAIFVAGPTANLKITANTFRRIGYGNGKKGAENSAAILAYHLNYSDISDNNFQDVYQAISLIFEGHPHTGNKISVTRNMIKNAIRMGIEAQGNGTHKALFEGNHVEMSATGDEDIGLSIVLTGGTQTLVKSNTALRKRSASGRCAGMGIEAAGINTTVANNTIKGPWCSAIGVYADKTQFSNVIANHVCGHRSKYEMISFYNERGFSTSRQNKAEKDCK